MYRIKYLIVWIEIFIIKIRKKFFNYKQDESIIPKWYYCYDSDKDCKYFRSINGDRLLSGCTYKNFIGIDFVHWDQCKICNINNK